MSLPVSGLCSSAPNYSSRFSSTRDSTDKCLLRFSQEFLNTADEISKWYNKQHFRRFQTIQYRKERTAIGHEFIILLLQGKHSSDINCHCRVERVGDPEYLAQVICIDGTTAEDYIQAIPQGHPGFASLTGNSDIIAEITFPLTFDLRDVLAICYGISKHYRAKRYTLQQYNCYFFSWTIILSLARACMHWDVSPSIPEHLGKARDCIIKSINEHGPARFRSIAYILSNNTLTSHENEEEHPLDQAIRSRLYDQGFTDSMTKALRDVFWTNRLRLRLVEALKGELKEVASKSIHLTTWKEIQIRSIYRSTVQNKCDLDFKHALDKLTQKTMGVILEKAFRALSQVFTTFSPEYALIKQRLGHEVWFKSLAHCLQHPRILFQNVDIEEISSGEQTKPRADQYQADNSPIRAYLFIPPSIILSFCARLGVTCALTMLNFSSRRKCDFRDHGNPLWSKKKHIFQSTARGIGTTIHSAILSITGVPTNFITAKHFLLFRVGDYAAVKLDPIISDVLKQIGLDSEAGEIVAEGCEQGFKLFNDGLLELTRDDEQYDPNLLRQCLSTSVIAMMGVIGFDFDFENGWSWILRLYFIDKMAEVAGREFADLIERDNVEMGFQVIRRDDYGLSQLGTPNDGGCRGAARPIKVSNVILPFEARPVTNYGPDSWSYQKLQQYIRGRISQLSKRENNFAPYLKHIPFAKSPEVCQKEIEVTMEDIWRASARLITTRS
ncbi:hypothetical protein RSAG8_10813, partial [Rhizoctonia solani AG-8 WAC10335]